MIAAVRLHESDIIWKFDMMKELGVQQHNMATCAPTIWGDVLFICTSNGVGDSHIQVSAPNAPSFMAMDKHTGNILWTDNSPGENILHGQWSCPVVGILGGVPTNIQQRGKLYSLWAAGASTEKVVINPNSAAVWHYDKFDLDRDGMDDFEETMHRTVGSPAIKNNLLFIADFSGIVHCLNAKTGRPHWTCDLLAACWTTPLIVGENVYISDEDGDVAIFALSTDPSKSLKKARKVSDATHEPLNELNIGTAIFTMPVVANNILYIASRNRLFAIAKE